MHIYHSALELCPTSSIVRKLYYEQCNRIVCLPRVVIGVPDSWDKVASVSIKDRDRHNCAWSPCSQLIAVQTGKVVEIRSQLTLELFTTLQPTETILNKIPSQPTWELTMFQPTETSLSLTGRLAYSPDGCSLAYSSNGFILIWDIQTGGVVREIECDFYPASLAWSLDGRVVGVIRSEAGQADVITYDVASGRRLFTGLLYSENKSPRSEYLWAYKETFLVITTQSDLRPVVVVDIFEVQDILVNIHSFSLTALHPDISFSPTTCRISVSDGNVLRIFENWNSTYLLEETGWFKDHTFSSDGSLFAAFKDPNVVHLWKYGSPHFLPWKTFPFMGTGSKPFQLQFSPNLSSIMQRSDFILNVWRLHDLPPLPTTDDPPEVQAGLTRSGQIVQASGNFITILNPHSRPSRVPVFDAGAEIEGFVLTGNVLLVATEEDIVAWLVPPAGFAVDEPLGHKLADHRDAFCTIKAPSRRVKVVGEIGFIGGDSASRISYHTETGEVLNLDYSTTKFHEESITNYYFGSSDFSHFHNLRQKEALPGDGWQPSGEGWVRDSEGRCRLWLPVHWRGGWRAEDWWDDATTQFSIIGGEVVIVKF